VLESPVVLVPITTVAALVLGAVYYAVFGGQLAVAGTNSVESAAAASAKTSPWTFGVEIVRCFVLAGVVTGLAVQGKVDTWTNGLMLGLVLWIGFPAVLWIGAIVHEKSPWRLAAIHAGDWLVKLLVLGTIVGVLR